MDDAALARFLRLPLRIADREVPGRLCLAAMAGLGHVAFRECVAEYGGHGLLFTGMMNAAALPTENPAMSPVFRWRTAELPHLVGQIFGNDPAAMARAAMRLEAEGFFGVDINMGCCAAAILKRGAGAALLREPERAAAIVRAVRRAVRFPVFVKFRTGFDPDPEPAARLARQFEAEGADALTFHPRIAPDRRTRPPLLEHLRRIKQSVRIPVFGNGNVFTRAACVRMLETTGCDGVALGRMAVARPWIFADWTARVPSEPGANRAGLWQSAPLRFLDALERHFDPAAPGNEIRRLRLAAKFLGYYAANFTWGNALLARWRKAPDLKALRRALERDLAQADALELSQTPNLHLFMR